MNRIRTKHLLLFLWLTLALCSIFGAGKAVCAEAEAAAETAAGTEASTAAGTEAAAEESMRLSLTELKLRLGTTETLEIWNLPENLTVKSWKSSKTEKVQVSGQGAQVKLRAVKPGKVTITATLSNGKKLKCKVTVPKVRLSKTKITLARGQEAEITLKGTTAAGKWKSSKKKVAKPVTQGGKTVIQALKYGTATITVTCESVSLTCEVTVKDPVLSRESLLLLEGDSCKLKVKKSSGDIRWLSADPEVAEVTDGGRVEARKSGQTTIQAKVDGVTLSCPVTVGSFAADTDSLRVKVGEVVTIPESGTAAGQGTWSSENPRMAEFDASGRLTALKPGEVELTYTVGDSTYSCRLLIYGKKADTDFAAELAYRRVRISSLRNLALSSNSRYQFMQGCATDGTYGYFVLCDQNYQNSCALIKVRLADWTVTKVKTGLPIYHGNDLAYNSKKKVLVAVHCDEGDFRGISMISPKTLEVTGTVHLDVEVNSVTYYSGKNSYVFGVAGTNRFVIKDDAFHTTGEFECLDLGNYTRQGLDSEKSYIYILQSCHEEAVNRVLVYTWKGKFVTQIFLQGDREAESLFHIGKKFVIAYNDSSFGGGNMLETSLKPYYQIRYTSGGGEGDMPWQMASVSENVKLQANTFRKAGHRFVGWRLTRSSDGKVCCRRSDGKVVWLDTDAASEDYEVFLVPDEQKIAPMSTLPGDSITLQAQWAEK